MITGEETKMDTGKDKEQIREELIKEKTEEADNSFSQNIIDRILAGSRVEVSDLIVEDEVDRALERQQRQFAMYGLNFSDFLQYSGKTLTDYRAEQAEKARKAAQE